MRKLFLAISVMVLFLSGNALANVNEHDHSSHEGHSHSEEPPEGDVLGVKGASCQDKVVASVNGLVCDFCARALEKTFSKQEQVSGINVDLDSSKVTIAMKEGHTMEEDVIKKLITDSGYNVTAIDKGC